jgi:hypothetical protein
MNEPPKEKPFPKVAVAVVILSVIALAIIFVVLASIGDDVPTELAPATQNSPGN